MLTLQANNQNYHKMKKQIKITLENGKADYIAILPVIAYENNKAYRSFTIGVQFLNRYAEIIFTL